MSGAERTVDIVKSIRKRYPTIPVIAAIKAELSKRPAPEITVIGHTDRVGKLEGNDELSKRRAEAVRDILSGDGIKAASMEVAGRGGRLRSMAYGEPAEIVAVGGPGRRSDDGTRVELRNVHSPESLIG